jgi:hypothetical protein
MQTPNNRSGLRTKQEIAARFARSKSFHFADGFYESFNTFYPARLPCDVFFEEVVHGCIAHGTSPTDGKRTVRTSSVETSLSNSESKNEGALDQPEFLYQGE